MSSTQSTDIKKDWDNCESLSHNQKLFLTALEQYRGNVSKACRATNTGRQTHYNWRNEYPEYLAYTLDISEMSIDHVEDKLLENIDNNDTTAIIFFLKTRAKARGYVEKTELEVKKPEPTIVEWTNDETAEPI